MQNLYNFKAELEELEKRSLMNKFYAQKRGLGSRLLTKFYSKRNDLIKRGYNYDDAGEYEEFQ